MSCPYFCDSFKFEMKETIVQYARYHVWANKRITTLLQTLSEEQLDATLISSFPSIRKTVLHAFGAEDVWMQRLLMQEHPVWKGDHHEGSFESLSKSWIEVSKALLQFAERQLEDRSFKHVLQYYNSKKEYFKQDVGSILLHVFNHASYHRGQLVTLMRQVGCTKIPNTDFISFVRNPKL